MRPILIAALTLLGSCSSPAARSDPAIPAGGEVRWFGELRAIMHEGRTDGVVELSSVVGPKVYGVGALGGMEGEVTIADGEAWLSFPEGDPPRTVRTREPREEAALLVAARVDRWRRFTLERDVPFEEIGRLVAELARSAGIDADRPFPFLVEGALADLGWHVIDGRAIAAGGSHADHAAASLRGHAEIAEGRLVGFHSERHEGVFTHRGSSTHMHVLLSDPDLTGHVDSVRLTAGSAVLLPAARAADTLPRSPLGARGP